MRRGLYIVMVLVAVVAIVLSIILDRISSTAVFDSNLDLFLHRLTAQDQDGIFWAVHGIMLWQIVLLVATNLAWAIGVGVVLFGRRRPLE